jgi:hypothetical protein
MRFKSQEKLINNLVDYISKVRKNMDDSPKLQNAKIIHSVGAKWRNASK